MSEVDDDFGRLLREHRLERGWRQQDLVDAWDGALARSTLANVESGRERPTPRLWGLIDRLTPEWVSDLEPAYRRARRELAGRSDGVVELGGPFRLESLQLSYVFRHDRAPEEIIEVRRVRALQGRADGYGLRLPGVDTRPVRVDEEALWGGHLEDQQHLDADGRAVCVRRVVFDRVLRRGQRHEFAVRSWVRHDPDPCSRVQASLSVPVDRFTISLSFLGSERPESCFAFGPSAGEQPLALSPAGTVSYDVTATEPGSTHGVGWRWAQA